MAGPQLCPECGHPLQEGHIVCQKCGLLLPEQYRTSALLEKMGLSREETVASPPAHGDLPGDRKEPDVPAAPVFEPCDQEGEPCEVCSRAVNLRCSACGTPLCADHVLYCGVCHKPFCSDHIGLSCSLCTEYVCPDCLFHCPSCDRVVGADHVIACSACGKVICEACMTRTGLVRKKNLCPTCSGPPAAEPVACEECGEILDESRGSWCTVCGKRLCRDHTVSCTVCNKPFCREHIHRSCSLCENYVCPDCLLRCPRCNSIVGADHLHECHRCGQVVCKNCVAEVGFMVKRKYCLNRCEQLPEDAGTGGFFSSLVRRM